MSVSRLFANLICRDLDQSRDFYTELFDLKVRFQSDWFVQLGPRGKEGFELGLLRRDHDIVPAAGQVDPQGCILTIVVDDVDSVYRRARAQQLSIEEWPRDLFYGQRRMVVRDPDGMLLDISTPCSPDPQWSARVHQNDDGTFIEDP